ncbi:MAG: hypothetical protein IJX99_01920 [Clostridia bacterium]|nr:hypothetical protein [Clostridia bacterium]
MEQNNEGPIQEVQPQGMKDKLKEWYLLRQKVGKEKTFGDLIQRQENLEALEKEDLSKLEKLQQAIEKFASAIGVQFDPETGEVYFGEKRPDAPNVNEQDINETSDELSRVSNEHSGVTAALYGDEMDPKKMQSPEQSNNPGIRAVVTATKENLMRRDVAAKKLLEARVQLESVKDRMDMNAAAHVAKKHRLMMQMEQAKIELVKRVAAGAKENDMSVQILKQEIQGIANQILGLEKKFEVSRDSITAEFNAAKMGLEGAQKEVELERKDAGAFNKYSRNLTYSEDGVLNGSSIEGVKNGNTINEQELYDERGVMIFDVADVLSRRKSINIEGIVVSCVTEFGPGPDVEDSFYIGDMEKLETSTTGGGAIVEEKPDIEEAIDNENAGKPTEINLFERMPPRSMFYDVNGVAYPPDMLSAVPEEQRQSVGTALKLLGYDKAIGMVDPASLATTACEAIARQALENALENDSFGEIRGPFDSNNN